MPESLKIEQPVPAAPASSFLTVGAIKTVFDVSWKLIPALWFAMQFYSNSQSVEKKTVSSEEKISKLQTDFNAMDRALVEVRADLKATREQADSDRQFFLQTQPPGRRKSY